MADKGGIEEVVDDLEGVEGNRRPRERPHDAGRVFGRFRLRFALGVLLS